MPSLADITVRLTLDASSLIDGLDTLREAMIGHRNALLSASFTLDAAEAAALELHGVLVEQLQAVIMPKPE